MPKAMNELTLLSDMQLSAAAAEVATDMRMCRVLLAHAVTQFDSGASVQERLNEDIRQSQAIRAEQNRRGYIRRKARQTQRQGGNRGQNYQGAKSPLSS